MTSVVKHDLHTREALKHFDTRRVSPSRIGTYADCGEKFRFKYIDGAPPERKGSAALFGKVMHNAREHWVMNRKTFDFIELVRHAWKEETEDEPVVRAFLNEYSRLSGRAIRLVEEIHRRRPEIVNARMTKDFKTSDIAGEINALLGIWLPRLEESAYDFSDRDPLPALYDESLKLAWKYSEKWIDLPDALYTEFEFEEEWEGYELNGFIDDISPLVDQDTGEMIGYGICDAKTYRQPHLHRGRDGRQLTIYGIVVRKLVADGRLDLDLERYPLYASIDLMRLLTREFRDIGPDAVKELLHDCQMYERGVKNAVFLPATKTCASQFCDFRERCEFNRGTTSVPVELPNVQI